MNSKEIMEELGCEQISVGVYRHPRFAFDFKMHYPDKDVLLEQIYMIAFQHGQEAMRGDFKELLGVE